MSLAALPALLVGNRRRLDRRFGLRSDLRAPLLSIHAFFWPGGDVGPSEIESLSMTLQKRRVKLGLTAGSWVSKVLGKHGGGCTP